MSYPVWPEFSIDPTQSQFKTVRVWARSHGVSPDIHYSICSDSHSPNLLAASCRHVPRRVLTNSLQCVVSLQKSEKLGKVLSGCLEKLTHGWSLGYSDLPSGKSEYPWDHPRVNFSRQPLRTFRYLYHSFTEHNQVSVCLSLSGSSMSPSCVWHR